MSKRNRSHIIITALILLMALDFRVRYASSYRRRSRPSKPMSATSGGS